MPQKNAVKDPPDSLSYKVPTSTQITDVATKKFGYPPCKFQVQATLAQLQQYYHGPERQGVVCVTATGSGKTLAFILPILFNNNGISILITPLNALGSEMEKNISKLGISVINLTGVGQRAGSSFKEAATGKYRIIITSPELVANVQFRLMCFSATIRSRLFSVIFDEGHCISQWGDHFRPAYATCGDINWLVPPGTIFYITSATLPAEVLTDVLSKLHLTKEQVTYIIRSNDRPNIFLDVKRMRHPQNSYRDPRFVLPSNTNDVPERFLIFFNSRDEAEESVKYFIKILPPHLKKKIVWLHAGMTNEFREDCIERLKRGDLYGICCTDAVGMGLDIQNILLVVQYRLPQLLCTLMQRLGRAARDKSLQGKGVVVTEPKYFDDEIAKAAERTAQRSKNARQKKAPKRQGHSRYSTVNDEYKTAEKAIIDFVNAARRKEGCHRSVSNNRFGIKVSGIKPLSNEDCCPRCSTTLPVGKGNCCILCDVRANSSASDMDIDRSDRPDDQARPSRAHRRVQKCKVKEYTPTASDLRLREALDQWRLDIFERDFPDELILGPSLVLPDAILDRIVDLAHVGFNKISTAQQLKEQTGWTYSLVDTYWPAIHSILQSISKENESISIDMARVVEQDNTTPVLAARTNSADDSTRSRKKRKMTCGACGGENHIASNRLCPKHPSKSSSNADKENNLATPAPVRTTALSKPLSPNTPIPPPLFSTLAQQHFAPFYIPSPTTPSSSLPFTPYYSNTTPYPGHVLHEQLPTPSTSQGTRIPSSSATDYIQPIKFY